MIFNNLLFMDSIVLFIYDMSVFSNVLFTRAAYFSASSKVICRSIAWWWSESLTRLNKFSIGFMSGLLGGTKNFVAPTACMACYAALLFWLGSPSCMNSLPVGLTLFSNVLGKWSRMKSPNIFPFMRPSYCSQKITPCVCYHEVQHNSSKIPFKTFITFSISHCFDWLCLVKRIVLVLETSCVNVRWNSIEPKFFWVGPFWYFCSILEPAF